MQTGNNISINSNSSSLESRWTAASVTTAAAASVSSRNAKMSSTDRAERHIDNGFVDPSEERGSADGLHQLSLCVIDFLSDCGIHIHVVCH